MKDILIWIGKCFYPKLSDFISEALTMGCMRRLPRIPKVEYGKSRCFMIYRLDKEEAKLYGVEPGSYIFGYFPIHKILYVVDGVNIDKKLKEREVEIIDIKDVDMWFMRGCGHIHVGGVYVISEEDINKIKDLVHATDLMGNIHMIEPFIPYNGGRFRGFRYIDGDEIMDKVKKIYFPDEIVKHFPFIGRRRVVKYETLMKYL